MQHWTKNINNTYIRGQQPNQIRRNYARYRRNAVYERRARPRVVRRNVHSIDLHAAVEPSHESHGSYKQRDSLQPVTAGVRGQNYKNSRHGRSYRKKRFSLIWPSFARMANTHGQQEIINYIWMQFTLDI